MDRGWTVRERSATRVLPDGSTERIDELDPSPVSVTPVGGLEKLRRGILVLTGLGVVGAGVALAPYVSIVALTLLIWVLRSGSMAASSAGARRQLRGARWYDGVQVLLAAPWHVVKAIPGTLLLVLWSLGLGVAAALLCFAGGAAMVPSLAVIGIVLGASMWWGPGSRRLRGPVHRLAHPVSARPLVWFFAAIATAAVAAGLGAAASAQGTSWAPDNDRPFADVRPSRWF